MFLKACHTCLLLVVFFAGAAQRTPRAIFIIADGIPADVLERHPAPALKRLAATGTYSRAYVGGERGSYSQSPTISAVGYNSLLTGTWANKHNVWDNEIDSPNHSYPTIFRLLRAAKPGKTLGIFSTWTDNRTKLAGESLAQTGGLMFDFKKDGYELDTIRFPHDPDRNFIHAIDELVTTEAAAAIGNGAPDLSWIYLEYPDDMGHRYGDGPELAKAIEYLDRQIALIEAAIRQRPSNEDWLLVVTTDHGRDSVSGKGHGRQSNRERTTWIISNKKLDNRYSQSHTPGIVDIYPTLARHLNIPLPDSVAFELDGVPLIGQVSVAGVDASLQGDSIVVAWKALAKEGSVNVFLSTTDERRKGGNDTYRLVATVPAKNERFVFKAGHPGGNYFKVVVKGTHNAVGRWVGSTGMLFPRR